MFSLWPFLPTIEVGNLSVYICEKTGFFENLFTGWSFENACSSFGEKKDGSPHNDIIKEFFKKLWKSIYKCEIDFLGQTKITWINLWFWIIPKT